MGIKKRTKERLEEEEKEMKNPIEMTEEEALADKAPLGPGGLDPTEVLNSLPQVMQDAFMEKDMEKLKEAVTTLPEEEARKYMSDCVKSGLWVASPELDSEDEDSEASGDEN